jgi:hypothetical protein
MSDEAVFIGAVARELDLLEFRQMQRRHSDAVRVYMTPRRRWIVEILSSWEGRTAALAVGDPEAKDWDVIAALEAELKYAKSQNAKWCIGGGSDPAAPSDFTNWRHFTAAGQGDKAGPTPWTEIN